MLLVFKVFDDPALRRAKESIEKRGLFASRPRMFIQRHAQIVIRVFILCLRSPGRRMVEDMMHWCSEKVEYRNVAYLFLLTYVFLLRLPSEALPVVAGQGDEQACFFREGQTVVLELKRRKNKPAGSRLVRTCWCSVSEVSSYLFEQHHVM